ncbi:N-acetylmuramoyl-L-alanine amidase [Crocosphaera sp. UHCC 0190]|uniref:N-acetylmuramoyl-L-alanine amidase n=1 Tax=Crocosphaera sp. UHCC 0190 TaxID=3110246 RepID=UPI002B1FA661|nr:N-acetylmuramoyl-L-alanine amidase [Crocosphaera sp. UHCC 0190]MEA5509054.1 N-acetylmuramoyl-L-alanine amidase [Crocosphaera sp. UHCC 0190]
MKQLQGLFWGLVASQAVCIAVDANTLEYWDFDVQQNRLEIVTENGVRPQASMIPNPTRLIIDLPGVSLGQGSVHQGDITGYVTQVRVGQVTPYTTRIVVELGRQYSMRPWEVKVRSLGPNRWYVQLAEFQPHSVYSLPVEDEPVAIMVPLPSPNSNPVYSPRGGYKVVIDPGHGGRDPGAIGIGGLQEKNVVLSIAAEVTKILKQRGIQVIMTRSGDYFVSLLGRVKRAENSNANVFVSIHANAVGGNNSQVNGLETYYYSSGYRLALSIHRNILQQVQVEENRGVKQARFYVLRKTSMPAALVEVGFVTGRTDNRNLKNPSYRKKLAEAIADGITEYLR